MTIAQLQRAKEIENRLISLVNSQRSIQHFSDRGISTIHITARGGVGCSLDIDLLNEVAFCHVLLDRVRIEIEQLTTELTNL